MIEGEKYRHINGDVFTIAEIRGDKIVIKNNKDNRLIKVGVDFFYSNVETEGGVLLCIRFIKNRIGGGNMIKIICTEREKKMIIGVLPCMEEFLGQGIKEACQECDCQACVEGSIKFEVIDEVQDE